MTKTHYRQFLFTLTTLAPVHIGSGDKYTSKDYIYEKNAYYFPDMQQFCTRMIALGKNDAFEEFLLKRNGNSNQSDLRLINFLHDERIAERDFGGYKIAETGFESVREKGRLNAIAKFIRDGQGQIYIPGSSLKGAIRTILLNTHWKDIRFRKESYRKKQVVYSEDKWAIPWGAKKGEEFDDIFNDIRVSDSKPIKTDLILAQKWDYSATKRAAKSLPLTRECLKPLTKVEFTITTTSKRAGDIMADLPQLANEFYQEYKKFFLSEILPDSYIQDNVQYPIYLGAGSGAWTKTIIKEANGPLQERYARMKKTKMKRKGAAKLTKYKNISYKTTTGKRKTLVSNDDNFYEMGKACFLIKEVGE